MAGASIDWSKVNQARFEQIDNGRSFYESLGGDRNISMVSGNKADKFGLEFYYNAVDGMVFNNGKVMSRNDFVITLDSDFDANARYRKGFNDGKYHVNFDIGEYEVTRANVQALMIHEAYGHGVMGY